MRRTCAALATVLSVPLVSIALAQPAWAKGPVEATISGPGLDEPIEVLGGVEDAQPSYLVVALIDLTSLWETAEVRLEAEPPRHHLGEPYTLTWLMARPDDADPADYTVRQDLYPNPRFGSPVVHVHPSRYLRTEGGWFQTSDALRDTLAALGVPVGGVSSELARRSTGSEAGDESDPRVVREPAVWPTAAAAAGGLAAGLGIGRVLTWRRVRRQRTAVQAT